MLNGVFGGQPQLCLILVLKSISNIVTIIESPPDIVNKVFCNGGEFTCLLSSTSLI